MLKDVVEGFRLAPQQERVWRLQHDGHDSVYRAQCVVAIEGSLAPSLLREVIGGVVRRHEILRTNFYLLPSMTVPLQVIGDGRVGWREPEDLSGLGGEAQESRVEELLREMRHQPLNFERDELSQAALLSIGNVRHLLLITFSSLCLDAAGLDNLVREIGRGYAASVSGEQLTDEPLQYADLSEWQNDLLESEEMEIGRAFWRQQDFSSAQLLKLRAQKQPAADAPFEPETLSFVVAPQLSGNILALCAKLNMRPDAFLLACWQVLLWRLTGQPRVIVAVVFNGRMYKELENAVGLFARYLPVAGEFGDDSRFMQILAQASRGLDESGKWQGSFSWELIRKSLAEAEGEPFFPFAFEFKEMAESFQAGGLTFSIGRQFVCSERFKVKLRCVRASQSLVLELQYDARLFSIADVQRLGVQFQKLLQGVVAAAPEARVGQLDILGDAERQVVLYGFNQTRTDEIGSHLIHHLVERQAERTPDNVAVVFEDESLTYAELNRRANSLGHHLRERGVGPDAPVGICAERSLDLVVGLLGILKAGGAYLPLDPGYPKDRLAFMLENARPSVLLAQEKHLASLPAHAAEVVSLDGDLEMFAGPDHNPASGADVDSLAYVIYTSGSTGRPKGVMISHRAICNRLLWMQHATRFTEHDRFLQKTPFSFDASVWELFVPLVVGATLIMAQPDGHQDSAYMAKVVAEQKVTVLQLVPSMLQLFLEEDLDACRSLKHVFCGGEVLPMDLQERFFARLPVELHNLYGPTEVSIDATHWLCPRGAQSATIGHPLANVQVYILDDLMRPVPIGVSGELCVGGAGLARGYLGSPDLTAARFIPDPFGGEPGARLYKTGDVGCHLPDGRLEFFGRLDHQIKLRGFRIELGEIEVALAAHPAVREAVVEVREGPMGTPRLVAYVVPSRTHLALDVGRPLATLPNGLEVADLNRNETDIIYREIFEDETYLKYGVAIKDGDCIFDVGANIGLFTLFVHQRCPNARVYAFEPIPVTFAVLQTNVALYGLPVNLFECGLADQAKQATLTFYPQVSAMSGVYADAGEDERVTRAFVSNQVELPEQLADELMAGRFASEKFVCSLRTLSEIIAEQKIEAIDLLKIDVEKSELDVLMGIRDEDWARIKQIVLEVHDIDGRLELITNLLSNHGFAVNVEQDRTLEHTGLYNIYALHPARVNGNRALSSSPPPQPLHKLTLSAGELRRHVAEKLPEYMIPSAFVMLDEWPLMPNGKLDRRGLPEPDAARPEIGSAFVAPRTPVEEVLVGLWCEVLGIERVGIHDNFFELGGHSLIVTQIVARIREIFHVEISLRTVFESPTVLGLAEAVDLAIKSGFELPDAPIPSVARDGELPLSFAQQRLWFLHQLEPEGYAYNLTSAVRLRGRLNVAALEQTLNEIVNRHESLRTTFEISEGRPVQRIAPSHQLNLLMIDLSELPAGEREVRALSAANEEARRPFDLTCGPLTRVTLLRLGAEEHAAVFTQHHIVSDGWSLNVLIREVAALYEAYSAGLPNPLPPLTVQYADFAAWQREYLQGERLGKLLSYWETHLGQTPPVLELPTDRSRPPVQSDRGASYMFALTLPLKDALNTLSRRNNATLFMTLLAAFNVLLMRYTGQEDVVIGTPIANRSRVEVEGLIGFFVNTLALRTDLSGNPPFRDLLGRVRETALGAYAHQDVPFERLVEELQPTRNLNRQPLFQVMFVLQNALRTTLELRGLNISGMETENKTAHFDLTLTVSETPNSFGASIEYNKDLFDEATITRLARHYGLLLEGIVADPDQRIGELPLLTESERRRLLVEWNDTLTSRSEHEVFHRLFEEQVARAPDNVAVIFAGVQLTYRELNERANKLARRLQALGVGPDVLVGLFMERSLELAVSVLGVLKAGGAYVPLDPELPSSRLAFMIEDAEMPVLLTQSHLAGALPAHAARVLCVDSEWKDIELESPLTPSVAAGPENLAYVLYTSGSTGLPKGVMISHYALSNHLRWILDDFPFAVGERTLLKTPLSFDASVWEFHAALLSGGSVVIAKPGGHWDVKYLIDLLAEHQVTKLQVVPSLLWTLVEQPEFRKCESLRSVFSGGEALMSDLYHRFHEVLDAALHNTYGPTEVTVEATTWRDLGGGNILRATVPIGRPINNTKIYLLDSRLQLVPEGIPGELHVGGVGLARGYLGRPDLTAARFIPDPFGREAGARLYNTGDVARYLPDGDIEYLGRTDHQVKIRGQRVELGEIEEVLGQHAEVREVIVVAAPDGAQSQSKRLVAYVVPGPGKTPAPDDLRSFIKEKLPSYMAPSAYVLLDALPRTASGKTDRQALPSPDTVRANSQFAFVAPQTKAQMVIRDIWQDVLSVQRVGLHDNFFDIGGHSLLLVQVHSRLLEAFGKEITILDLFRYPTVKALADYLGNQVGEKARLKPIVDRSAKRQASDNRQKQLRRQRHQQHQEMKSE